MKALANEQNAKPRVSERRAQVYLVLCRARAGSIAQSAVKSERLNLKGEIGKKLRILR